MTYRRVNTHSKQMRAVYSPNVTDNWEILREYPSLWSCLQKECDICTKQKSEWAILFYARCEQDNDKTVLVSKSACRECAIDFLDVGNENSPIDEEKSDLYNVYPYMTAPDDKMGKCVECRQHYSSAFYMTDTEDNGVLGMDLCKDCLMSKKIE